MQLQQHCTDESPSKFQIASPTWIQNIGLQRGFSTCQAENTRFLWRWTYLNSFLLSLLILIGKVVPLCCLGKQERTEGEPTKERDNLGYLRTQERSEAHGVLDPFSSLLRFSAWLCEDSLWQTKVQCQVQLQLDRSPRLVPTGLP